MTWSPPERSNSTTPDPVVRATWTSPEAMAGATWALVWRGTASRWRPYFSNRPWSSATQIGSVSALMKAWATLILRGAPPALAAGAAVGAALPLGGAALLLGALVGLVAPPVGVAPPAQAPSAASSESAGTRKRAPARRPRRGCVVSITIPSPRRALPRLPTGRGGPQC